MRILLVGDVGSKERFEHMAQLFIAAAFIGTPNGTQDFFQDNRQKGKVRSYSVVPILPPDFDQQAEIVEVYSILKGNQHVPGQANTLQEHVVVGNKQGGGFGLTPPFLSYQIWITES